MATLLGMECSQIYQFVIPMFFDSSLAALIIKLGKARLKVMKAGLLPTISSVHLLVLVSLCFYITNSLVFRKRIIHLIFINQNPIGSLPGRLVRWHSF